MSKMGKAPQADPLNAPTGAAGEAAELNEASIQKPHEWTTAIFRYAEKVAAHPGDQRLSTYNEEKTAFERALGTWPAQYATQLKDTLEALRFIDWAHMASDLLETYRSRGRLSVLDRSLQ